MHEVRVVSRARRPRFLRLALRVILGDPRRVHVPDRVLERLARAAFRVGRVEYSIDGGPWRPVVFRSVRLRDSTDAADPGGSGYVVCLKCARELGEARADVVLTGGLTRCPRCRQPMGMGIAI